MPLQLTHRFISDNLKDEIIKTVLFINVELFVLFFLIFTYHLIIYNSLVSIYHL
jgi:hypothetical protein